MLLLGCSVTFHTVARVQYRRPESSQLTTTDQWVAVSFVFCSSHLIRIQLDIPPPSPALETIGSSVGLKARGNSDG